MATETRLRTCPLCEATCGLRLLTDGERVVRVRGDRDHVFSLGYLCPKGSLLGALHDDPDRLRQPMIRDRSTDTWREASWTEAFTEIERRLLPVLDRHGREALATYVGNPNVHNISLLYYGRQLSRALGTRNNYSAGTVDQISKQVASGLMFGGTLSVPVPDLDHTSYLLLLGANPSASNGSLLTAPDAQGRIDAIRERGGTVVVIDPRRTRTAELASEHHPIRPGTDALFLMALVQVLFADGLVDLGHLEPHVIGLDDLAALAGPFTPERVAAATGIDAADIRRIAQELAAAPTAAVYGRIGTCVQRFGTLASWLVDACNVLTGNLDRPGGALFPKAICGQPNARGNPAIPHPIDWGRWHTRVRGAPEVIGQLPAASFAEELDTPGPGQIRALVTIAGNPALSVPDAARVERGLAGLECMVSIDNYLNETTRHADVILPGESHLQQPHFPATLYQLAVRHVAAWSDPVFPPDPDRPREWEMLLVLAGVVSGAGIDTDPVAADDAIIRARIAKEVADPWSPVHGRDPDELFDALAPAVGPERVVDWQIRTGPYGDAFGANAEGWTLAKVRAHPHGADLGPLESRVPDVIRTLSGKIELAPPLLSGDVPRLVASLDEPIPDLVLIGRRSLRSNNSWMHNLPRLVSGSNRCTLLVHPVDAERLGLADADPAAVTSATDTLVAPVEISDEMMPGVVSLPHGWGHDRPGVRLGVASRHPGVNVNLLAAPGDVDPLSGNAAVSGIPVTVEPARTDRVSEEQ
ncbi:MAG: molybdopterin oxidoreductase family protein [Acidimicrobiales bacterium]|nr:molybdopterin oxidoreductase family protein [Acidimicrobiales bacterium]